MPSLVELRTFSDPPVPPGASPFLTPVRPAPISVVPADPAWSEQFATQEAVIREALGARVLRIDHVGSTSVPGLDAKPVIDIDLTVADPGDEVAYVPALVACGFEHTIREPWWYGHRMLRGEDPAVNLHVFGPDSPETWRHLILRDHLRRDAADRALYAAVKREAAESATARGETMDQYNARKQEALRGIVRRAMQAAGI